MDGLDGATLPRLARDRIGVNSTGLPFNSSTAIERGSDGRTNPMVNPGAIATTSLVPGDDAAEKWEFIQQGLSAFAGRELSLNDEIYRSASQANQRNESIARLLQSYRRICDPSEVLHFYTKQCSLNVTAKDLAAMGATLADAGVNPFTRDRVVDSKMCRHTLAVMATAGMYETSGDWLYERGLDVFVSQVEG
jgi:glutaminase